MLQLSCFNRRYPAGFDLACEGLPTLLIPSGFGLHFLNASRNAFVVLEVVNASIQHIIPK